MHKANNKPAGASAQGERHSIEAIRARDIRKVLEHTYGLDNGLPDDDAGRDDLVLMLHHLALLAQPRKRMRAFISLWAASWLPLHDSEVMITTFSLTRRSATAPTSSPIASA
jgi:hypothetical protein